jgi:hypothetical protein
MNTAPNVRERQVNIRLSEAEAERLELVCRHYGLNGANLFRMFLTREETAIRREAAAHAQAAATPGAAASAAPKRKPKPPKR